MRLQSPTLLNIHSLTSIGSALLRFAGAPFHSSSSAHLQDDEIHFPPPTPSSSQHSSPPPPSTPLPTPLSPPPSSPPPPPPPPPLAEAPPSPPPPSQHENEQQKTDAIEVKEPEKEEQRPIQFEEKPAVTVPLQASPPPPPPLAQAPPNTNMPRSLSPPPTHLPNTFPSPHHSPNSSPPYSPSREQANLFVHFPSFMSEDPPPPPSPPRGYTWDYFDFFQLAPIPFHLHQQGVKVKHVDEEEEAEDLEEVQEQKEIPNLENEHHENEQQEGVAIEVKEPEIEEKREIQFEEKPAKTVPNEQPVETVPEDKPVEPVENVPPKAVENASKEKEPEIVKEKIPEKIEEPIKHKEEVPVVQKVAAPVKVSVPGGQNKKQEKEKLSVIISSGKNLIDVAKHIDFQFKRTYVSGKDVAGLLEATKVHTHSPFSEFRDSIKVFNAVTSYWSIKTPLTSKVSDEDSDMAECGMAGSHASTLERLFAWEKKLYEEVKAGEAIRLAFDRKCKQLKSQDAKGTDPNVIDKTRADMKKLDTRLMVAICAIHLTSLRIQKVTDEELYPQLLEILKGLMSMWKVILECHKNQKKIAANLMTLESSAANEEISEAHQKATVELENQMDNWQKCFSKWIDSQSSYITNLFSWLTSCQLEADSKGRVAPSYQPESPAVFSLIENWYMAVERLKDHKEMVDAVNNFSTVLHSLQLEQLEELKQKRRAEGFAKDLDQKLLLLQNMEKKYVERPFESDEKEDYTGMRSTIKNTLQERRVSLNELRSRVTEEKKKHDTSLQDRREATIRTLKTNLPNIFEAIAAFAATAVDEYERLQQQ